VQYNETMAISRRLGLLAGAIGVATVGCSPFKAADFTCTDSDQCIGVGPDPRCESGFCTLADDTCPSHRRFGALSGGGTCVAEGAPDGGLDDVSMEMPIAPFCDPADTTLAGCWPLDGNFTDGSANHTNGSGSAGVTFVSGKDGMAAQLATVNDHIGVPDTAALSPPSLTIEAWIQPVALPAGRMGIADNDSSYGLFLQSNGSISCTATVVASSPAAAVAAGTWTHVACTYDGTAAHVYVNGVDVGQTPGTGALGAGNANGLAIAGNSPTGEALVGLIDSVRIWNVARTAAQICTAAGKSGC
jgi:concanavalin A-like lectin/glucanase superfamily protein